MKKFFLILGILALTGTSCSFVSSPENTACQYQGKSYEAGEQFDAGDGCNTCTCMDDGTVQCTEIACEAEEPNGLQTCETTQDCEDMEGLDTSFCPGEGAWECRNQQCVFNCEIAS